MFIATQQKNDESWEARTFSTKDGHIVAASGRTEAEAVGSLIIGHNNDLSNPIVLNREARASSRGRCADVANWPAWRRGDNDSIHGKRIPSA